MLRKSGWFLGLLLLMLLRPAAGVESQLLPEKETDAVLQGVFDRAKAIGHMQATMVTTKEGGFAKQKLVRYALVKFQTPARAWMLSRGASREVKPFAESTLTLFDGVYLWELEPEYEKGEKREVSVRRLRDDQDNEAASGLAVFLLGQNVTSVAELRKEFKAIECYREGTEGGKQNYHFRIQPKNEERQLELWIEKDGTIPWKIQTTTRKAVFDPLAKPGDPPAYKTSVEVRELLDVETNLDGLAPFAPDQFVFPYEAEAMTVLDEAEGNDLAPADVARLLDLVRERFAKEDAGEPSLPVVAP